MICELKMDKKVLLWILFVLGLLVLVFTLTSCSVYSEPYTSVERAHVKEKCRTFRNLGHQSAGDFLIRLGKEVNHIESYYGYEVYRIKVIMGQVLGRAYEIKMVVIYYD